MITLNSKLRINSSFGNAGVVQGDTLIFENVQITREDSNGTKSTWATSYSIQGNEITGMANGENFRIWLSGTNPLSNASQWQCDFGEPSPSPGRRIARAVTLGTFLGTLAGFLAGLAAHLPGLGILIGLSAALTGALSTGLASANSGGRIATTGGFVAEEGEDGPITVPPEHPSTTTPTLRVAGKR